MNAQAPGAGETGSIGGDEAAELAALQRQMQQAGDQVGPGGQRQAEIPIPNYAPPPSDLQLAHQQPQQYQQPQPQPGVQFGPAVDPMQQHQQPQQLPAAAVLDERRKRQEAERNAQQYQQQLQLTQAQQAKLEERVSMLGDVVARGQKSQLDSIKGGDDVPRYEDDPEGHIRAMNQRVAQRYEDRLSKLENDQQQTNSVLEQEALQRHVTSQVNAQSQAFQLQRPDFRQAYEFYITARQNDLIAQGFPADRVAAHVDQDELAMAEAHLRDHRNVPEAIYNAAVYRGYRPGQPPAVPQAQPGQQQPQPQPQQQYYSPQPAPNYAPQYAPPPQYQQPPASSYYPSAPNMGMQPPAAPQVAPALPVMQAGMMAGSHLAEIGQGGMGGAQGFPTLEQLYNMPEEQLLAGGNMKFVDAHIQGLQRAGH